MKAILGPWAPSTRWQAAVVLGEVAIHLWQVRSGGDDDGADGKVRLPSWGLFPQDDTRTSHHGKTQGEYNQVHTTANR